MGAGEDARGRAGSPRAEATLCSQDPHPVEAGQNALHGCGKAWRESVPGHSQSHRRDGEAREVRRDAPFSRRTSRRAAQRQSGDPAATRRPRPPDPSLGLRRSQPTPGDTPYPRHPVAWLLRAGRSQPGARATGSGPSWRPACKEVGRPRRRNLLLAVREAGRGAGHLGRRAVLVAELECVQRPGLVQEGPSQERGPRRRALGGTREVSGRDLHRAAQSSE